MMALEFDYKAMTAGLDEAGEEYRDALDKGFQRAGIAMVTRFQEEQLSGRRAPNFGLNIRTGNLRASLRQAVTTSTGEVRSSITNRGASYWAYHQDGAGHNPKRLYFEEEFQDQGERVYASEVERAFAAVAG